MKDLFKHNVPWLLLLFALWAMVWALSGYLPDELSLNDFVQGLLFMGLISYVIETRKLRIATDSVNEHQSKAVIVIAEVRLEQLSHEDVSTEKFRAWVTFGNVGAGSALAINAEIDGCSFIYGGIVPGGQHTEERLDFVRDKIGRDMYIALSYSDFNGSHNEELIGRLVDYDSNFESGSVKKYRFSPTSRKTDEVMK